MSKAGRIKQDVTAARSLLRHLEQGQTRWLAQLASPASPMLEPAQCNGVELIKALGRFDPMDGFDFCPGTSEPTPRKEPLGIGARPRSAVFPAERGREEAAATGAPPPRKRISLPSRSRYKRQDVPSDQPNTEQRATRGADPCAAALSAFRKTGNALFGGEDRNAARKGDRSTTQKSTLAARDNRVSTSAAKPITKAQQVAEARKALTRNTLPAEAERKPTREPINARPGRPEAPGKYSTPAELGNRKHIASESEAAIGQHLRNTRHQEEPPRGDSSARTGPPAPAAQPAASAPAGNTDEAGIATRAQSPVQVDELGSRTEPALPDQVPPAAPEPSLVDDDIAQQLADAARLHGVDLA